MIERAGFWRRGMAAFTDLVIAQLLLQGFVALLYAVSAGHVTTGISIYTSCSLVSSAPEGVSLPPGFIVTSQDLCTSSFFGAPTRTLYVARHAEQAGAITSMTSFAAAVSPDGRVTVRTLGLDALFYPMFILLRWASDRFTRGSLGRRLVRIAVTDASGTASGADLAPPLDRRYARFAWSYVPGTVMLASGAAFEATAGTMPPLVAALIWITGTVLVGVSQLVAAMAVFRHQDTFYDAPAGTAVATRLEIARAADMGRFDRVPPVPGPMRDLGHALNAARRSTPWLSLALVLAMVGVFLGETLFPMAPAGPLAVAVDTLMAWGGMDHDLVILSWQPYRMLAAIFVHASVAHLILNSIALMAAGFLLEALLGRALFAMIFLLGGLAGSMASITFNPPQLISVGASGGVLALFAAALPLSLRVPAGNARRWLRAWPIVVCIPALLPIVTIPGTSVVDRADHAGGEVGGLLLGIAIAVIWWNGKVRRPSRRVTMGIIAGSIALIATTAVFGGLRAPIQAVRLIPPGELPQDEAAWLQRASVLAARYPEDPRALRFLAQAEVLDHRPIDGLRDLDRAIVAQRYLAPSLSAAFSYAVHTETGSRFLEIGDLDQAIVQYTMALASRRDDVVAFRQRGIAEYFHRQPALALKDLDEAVKLLPVDAYAALWDDIIAVRAGEAERLEPLDRAQQDGRWPAPVLRFYQDAIDVEALERAVSSPDEAVQRNQRCEADFYRGERLIMRNDAEVAQPFIVAAAAECPHTFIEYNAAREELTGHGGLKPER